MSASTSSNAACTAVRRNVRRAQANFGNSAASQTLSQCATDPTKYYNADDGEELKQAFRDIAIKLTTIYLSK